MRLHINHKNLLKIQNHGKECAFPWFLNFFETSKFHHNINELSSRVLQNRRNLGWLSTNTITIATYFCGTITVQLAYFVDRDWFSTVFVEEISVQILEFIDRGAIVRQYGCHVSSIVLRGNKIFPSSFWPSFRRYRDDCFVDRATKCRK